MGAHCLYDVGHGGVRVDWVVGRYLVGLIS